MLVKETALSKLILLALLTLVGSSCGIFSPENKDSQEDYNTDDAASQIAAFNKANREALSESQVVEQPREVRSNDRKNPFDQVKRNERSTLYHLRPKYAFKIKPERLKKIKAYGLAGDADACYYLGIAYKYGRGVRASKVEAYQWLQRAEKLGHQDAKRTLTHMYQSGF